MTNARLSARPLDSPEGPDPVGLRPLGLGGRRDGKLYVPRTYTGEDPAALMVTLHGAGGHAEANIGRFRNIADDQGVILLAPDSRGRTWDVVLGGYGADPYSAETG